MKKILFITDGVNFSQAAFDFAAKVNEKERILLTGIFLQQVEYYSLWEYGTGMTGLLLYPELEKHEEKKAIENNIRLFEEKCTKENIEYRVHTDFTEFNLQELKKETRFADLAIIGVEKFYTDWGAANINDYLEETLHFSECPILIVPEKFDFPCVNLLTYDGSRSSVFAIKQFIYLFPRLCNNETILIFAKEGGEKILPEEALIREFAARHFPHLTFCKLEDNSDKNFTSWIEGKNASIVVSGAYGRSAFSLFFKKSFINNILADHKMPIFISHK